MRPRPTKLFVVLLTALAALLAMTGCAITEGEPLGSNPSSSATSGSSAAAFPRDVVIPAQGEFIPEQTIHLEARPTSIVVLSPSLTETVYGVGAGEQVKAVDKLSNYPAEAKTSELDAFAPNLEAIVGMEPDLVLVSNDQDGIVGKLTELEIPVAVLGAPSDLAGAYTQIEQVGELTGNDEAGTELAAEVKSRVEAAVAEAGSETERTYYWELDPTLYSLTSTTFIGSVLGEFGLVSIADQAPDAATTGGYPQLSNEFIIDADPNVIFAPGGDAEQIRQRPGWDVTRAVKDEAGIVVLDNDIASRWGPRLAEFAEQIGAGVGKLP
ncbi:ABC transporter substrate-binding protein [Propionibacteriaceae bacterium Y2011]